LKGDQLLKKIESGEIGNGVITLLSVFGSNNAKYNVMPTKDPVTHEWLGIPNVSEDERKSLGFHLKSDSNIILEHGITFNLKEKNSKAYWDMVKHSDIVKFTFEEAQNSPGAVFYIEMPSVENKKTVDHERLSNKAVGYILEDSYNDLKHRAIILNIEEPEDYDMETLQAMIIKLAKKNPNRIIDLYNSNVVSLKLLFYEALRKNIIIKQVDDEGRNPIYKYGIQILGTSEEGALAYLTDKANTMLVEKIKEHYDRVTDGSLFTQKEEFIVQDKEDNKDKGNNTEEFPDNLVQLREIAITKFGCSAEVVNALKSKKKVLAEIDKKRK